jgi:hypothetical protein
MAALSIAIADAQKRKRSDRQRRAETRLDEIVKVAGIADDYAKVDAAGDEDLKTHFGRMWNAAETEEMRTLVARTFAAWTRDEEAEERIVHQSVGGSVQLLKENNDFWLGASVPAGSDGAA